MTHKTTIIISALALLWGSVAGPQTVKAADAGNLRYDEEHLFIPTRIAPSEENIDGVFNQFYNPDVKLHLGSLITYDETKYSQAYVEAHLAEYTVNKSVEWVKGSLEFPAWVEFGEIVVSSSVANEEFLKNYRPGVVYYLMETTWRDNPTETQWYWGKVDYRQCTSSLKGDSFDLSGACLGQVNDDGEYVLRRVGASVDPGEKYISWAEELQGILEDQLKEVALLVEDWGGDAEDRRVLLDQLQTIRRQAEDVQETVILQTEIDELIARLGEEKDAGNEGSEGSEAGGDNNGDNLGGDGNLGGNGDLDGGNETIPEEAGKEPLPDSGGEAEPNIPSISRPSGSGAGVGNSGNGGDLSQSSGLNSTVNSATAVEIMPDNNQNYNENEAILGNLVVVGGLESSKNDQQSVLDGDSATKTEENWQSEAEDVEVPALNEDTMAIPYKKWLVLPAIGVILLALIALAVWMWRRYAYHRA